MIFGKSEEEERPVKKPKKEEDELAWDRKRLLLAGIIILAAAILAYEFKDSIFPQGQSILGEKSEIKKAEKPNIKSPDINFSSDVGAKIEDVKESVTNLSPEEIASSSPQIQKLLNDIQQIKNLPISQAKDACLKLCSAL
ncbi:MAG: hypothetical protein US96_C0017G0007 [Candidatus Woesebacteria bacterium GW2011_GWB1_38_5b]|uniref:Uncharacterized protein n=1 Tax=Candidatus Woesebacteria bacterium GW2011_GWB1_38_5b TaxID=1618569 RepID=A0A0G0NDF0_9BACT|nr:MAG: hypothetical protein US96_C0017G0007 [Candidatus Woesebacteria bacterium GW2011_GWB1_38_5b]OGH47236.1 MAG: hypothetical protein A3A51_01770 [Candidatus Levybacteria bacterium RIFCSPLOWO2_01_FULL_39_10]